MAKCYFCGKDVDLPFTCNYCGKKFCAEHRIPEKHDCEAIHKAKPPRAVPKPTFEAKIGVKQKLLMIQFTKRELIHLTAGLAVFFVVEASRFIPPITVTGIILPFLGALLAFGVHELAHKFVAQSFGHWAEFRIDPLMAVASLISVFTSFKVIAPGAVIIRGYGINKNQMGKISFAGPAINLILAFTFKLLSYSIPLLIPIAVINTDIALFNLLPVGFFDGRTIYRWDKWAWIGAFACSIILWFYIVLTI